MRKSGEIVDLYHPPRAVQPTRTHMKWRSQHLLSACQRAHMHGGKMWRVSVDARIMCSKKHDLQEPRTHHRTNTGRLISREVPGECRLPSQCRRDPFLRAWQGHRWISSARLYLSTRACKTMHAHRFVSYVPGWQPPPCLSSDQHGACSLTQELPVHLQPVMRFRAVHCLDEEGGARRGPLLLKTNKTANNAACVHGLDQARNKERSFGTQQGAALLGGPPGTHNKGCAGQAHVRHSDPLSPPEWRGMDEQRIWKWGAAIDLALDRAALWAGSVVAGLLARAEGIYGALLRVWFGAQPLDQGRSNS